MPDVNTSAVVLAFREYRDSIPPYLWTPELGEGFFRGWEACASTQPTELEPST